MSKSVVGTVKIKPSCTQLLHKNLDRIAVLFSAILSEKFIQEQPSDFVLYNVLLSVPEDVERTVSTDFVNRIQVSQTFQFLFKLFLLCKLILKSWIVYNVS